MSRETKEMILVLVIGVIIVLITAFVGTVRLGYFDDRYKDYQSYESQDFALMVPKEWEIKFSDQGETKDRIIFCGADCPGGEADPEPGAEASTEVYLGLGVLRQPIQETFKEKKLEEIANEIMELYKKENGDVKEIKKTHWKKTSKT